MTNINRRGFLFGSAAAAAFAGCSTAKAGAGVKSDGSLVISGTKGYILAQSPWWLTRGFDIRYEDPGRIDHYDSAFQGEDGLRYEIAEFVAKINGTDDKDYPRRP